MTRTDEAVAATLRRYRECVAAGFPDNWNNVRAFADLYRFAGRPHDDQLLYKATTAIVRIWKFIGMGAPSRRSVERILAALMPAEVEKP